VLIGVVALTVAPSLIDGSSSTEVGVVGTVPPGFEQTLTSTAGEDDEVTVTSYPDSAAADEALRADDVSVVWDPGAGQIVWEQDVDQGLESRVQVAATQAQFDLNAQQLGLSAAQQQQLLTPPTLEERTLEPSSSDDGVRGFLAFAGTVVLFIAISSFGGYVLTGVVNEKTSRIAEVLLSQVKASHLLAGKVLGIGAVALTQLLAIGVAVLVAGQLADTIPVPSIGIGAVLAPLGFFVLGFAIYATLYAAAGALVNRQEDTQAVVYPIMLPLLAGYLVAVTTAGDPDNPLSVVLSLFPLTAPVQMPLRIQLGDVPAWQVVASVALCLGFIWATIVVAGRVYAGALLRTGNRVKVREALRSAGDVGIG
jgi:ABC-2 type transport system permease protein